jgi:hypothetical protein
LQLPFSLPAFAAMWPACIRVGMFKQMLFKHLLLSPVWLLQDTKDVRCCHCMLLMPLMLGVQSFQFLSSCVDDEQDKEVVASQIHAIV